MFKPSTNKPTIHLERRRIPTMIDEYSLFVANTYQDFVADLQKAAAERQCRFAVYDAEYESTKGTGQTKTKLVFFYW